MSKYILAMTVTLLHTEKIHNTVSRKNKSAGIRTEPNIFLLSVYFTFIKETATFDLNSITMQKYKKFNSAFFVDLFNERKKKQKYFLKNAKRSNECPVQNNIKQKKTMKEPLSLKFFCSFLLLIFK